MPDAHDLELEIAQLFTDRLQVDVPAADVDLFATGVVDSLMFVKLLASLEERFGIHVSFEELEIDDFRTLAQIAAFVAAKRGAAVAARPTRATGPHSAPAA